ncbi:hypothetical protein SO802_015460 [Lithocarpus litseifolius]|uniref:SWIM-type domain-containing protein n=1 Tax=Lithocarpus litseifolius TaxID=425828 RepID=A0AAW2CUD8_9ROSI
MMIRRKLKTLNELKIKIMEELQVNPALHDIHITFRCPHEVLNQCINYRYMLIKEDKHVKIMFNMTEKWAQVTNIELYVTLERRAEVSIEEIIQTTTSLQVAVLDNHNNITLGGYTPPFQETPTTIESEPSNRYEDQFCTHRDDADAAITVQHVTNTPPIYEPPASSFYANTWENMVDPEVVQQAFASSWNADMNFAKGLIFANKEAVKRALIIYAAKGNKNFITDRSTKSRLSVKCMDESCQWYVGAVLKPELGLWMVTSYKGPHSCMSLGMARDGRMMDCNFLAAEFVPLFQKKHTATIFHLGDFITAKYEHKLSYYKIWDAKQKAIAKIFGDWEESYQRLRKLLLAYSDQEIGTRFWYHTIRSEVFGDTILRYVFWAFAPCIEGFKHCKPVISIDGTHLYGKYRGVLLIAMATDANNKVLPLAFAVVDKESGPSWSWFLTCLRNSFDYVIVDKDICVISDRYKGIQNGIANWRRDDDGRVRVIHRYCLRHVASNFNTHFQDATLKSLALQAGYATQEAKFELYMQPIKEAEIEALRKKLRTGQQESEPDSSIMPYTYLMKEDLDMWTQLHDGGYRYGAMTSNVSECFNGVLKGARGLPIAAMVEFTWSKLVAYFHDRHKEITHDLSEGKVWSTYVLNIYDKNLRKSITHSVRAFNNFLGTYQVGTAYNNYSPGGGHHSHEINIKARTCGCGKWQNLKIPCSHAIIVLQLLEQDATRYIDLCYSLENAIRTYSHQFMVPKSESLWRDVDGPKWVPNPALLRGKGRPVKSRIRNEMDGVRREPRSRRPNSDLREIQQQQSCGLCHQHGHNRRRCTPRFTDYKGKFTKLDNEKRLKEAEVIEGGYLELGFTFHRTRVEVIEMDSDTCILRTTIEYDVKEEVAANSSYTTIDAVAKLAELAKNHLIKNKASKDTR